MESCGAGVDGDRVRSADGPGEVLLEAPNARSGRQPARSQDRDHLVDLGIRDVRAEERNFCAHASPLTRTPSKWVRKKGTVSSNSARSQLTGAAARARGGARVAERTPPRSVGNSRASSFRSTRRTFGFAGLLNRKSYQSSAPRGARTRTISSATSRRIPESRMDVNTVDAITSPKVESGQGRRVASPRRRSAPVNLARARLTRPSAISIP